MCCTESESGRGEAGGGEKQTTTAADRMQSSINREGAKRDVTHKGEGRVAKLSWRHVQRGPHLASSAHKATQRKGARGTRQL